MNQDSILESKNKLTKLIDVLEEYIFIDNVTKIYNERWFNKCIYNEMELAIKTNTSITLILLQLEYIKETTRALDNEQEGQIYLENTKNFVSIVKKYLKDGSDQLFRMEVNEFLIVSKGEFFNHICSEIDNIVQEVMKSIHNMYLYFGVITITGKELSEDFNIITYLKKIDQKVKQNRQMHRQVIKQSKR